MNKEVSAQQVTDIKKVRSTQQIASECHLKCFRQGSSEACFEKCYDQLLHTFNGCLQALKEIGHDRHSRYIRLVFGPLEDPYERVERYSDLRATTQGRPNFYTERDYFDPTKDV